MVKAVYALVGTDALLQQEALEEIVRKLPADTQRTDVDGETAELADVLDELRSFAMFGGGKLVMVRSADELVSRYREQMEDYVAKPSDSATLVLRFGSLPSNQRIYKAIDKVGEIVSCQPPKNLKAWIVSRGASAHKLTVSAEAADLLAVLIGADLGRIDNELAKMALAFGGGRVGPDEIGQSVTFQREREMWDLTNALAAGDTAEALCRWRQLVQGDSSAEFRAVTWLGIWLENVGKALAMIEEGQSAFAIGQALRIWPRERQQPFVDAVKKMGRAGWRRALDLLAEMDFETKSGVGNAASNVERYILAVGAK